MTQSMNFIKIFLDKEETVKTIYIPILIALLCFISQSVVLASAGEKDHTSCCSDEYISKTQLDYSELSEIILKWKKKYSALILWHPEGSFNGVDLHQKNLQRSNLYKAFLFKADLHEANLSGSNLQMAMLKEANLQEAKLNGVTLTQATLTGANLQKAQLVSSDLRKANLFGADLRKAVMGESIFQGADLTKTNLQRAYMYRTNLQEATLIRSNLTETNLFGTNLKGANLEKANLHKANLMNSNLQNTDLSNAILQETNLFGANLKGANLEKANLQEANLMNSNLQNTDLSKANLTGANLENANLKGCIFELRVNGLPNILSIGQAQNLHTLQFRHSPHSLIELRKAFKDLGLRMQERQITYAIKKSDFKNAWPPKGTNWFKDVDLITISEVCLGWFFFDVTCKWGLSPERPLGIIIIFIFMFTIPYLIAIRLKLKKNGIWKVWIPARIRTDLGGQTPELLRLHGGQAVITAFYFSVLSAFNIGWRDINIGGWIAIVQPQEYRFKATGLIRSLSGIQSLISVFLIALSVLTYFGRPFQSY